MEVLEDNSNEITAKISRILAKENRATIREIKWLIYHLKDEIEKELNLETKIKLLSFVIYIFTANKYSDFVLIKDKINFYKKNFGLYSSNLSSDDKSIITIFYSHFVSSFMYNNDMIFWKMIDNIFHELWHEAQNQQKLLITSSSLNIDGYNVYKSKLLIKYNYPYYDVHHSDLLSEIEAIVFGVTSTITVFKKYAPQLYSKHEADLLKRYNYGINARNMNNDTILNQGINEIITPTIVEERSVLLYEYNEDASSKNLSEIIKYGIKQGTQNRIFFKNIIVGHLRILTTDLYIKTINQLNDEESQVLIDCLNYWHIRLQEQEKNNDEYFKTGKIDCSTYSRNKTIINNEQKIVSNYLEALGLRKEQLIDAKRVI